MQIHEGLEGVVVTATRLSEVRGDLGRLVVCGRRLEELTGVLSFEALCALLWDRDAVDLGPARVAAFARLDGLGDALDRAEGMDALRAAVAHLPELGPTELTAAMGVFLSAWLRVRASTEPLPPDPELPHAHDVLRMAGLDPERGRALDAYLVTVAEHGMNALTFAARVVTSTGSDAVSAVTAALGALKGPLHGGAPGPVLDMLDAVGSADRAAAWVDGELAAGRRIMGMGHRVYRVRDPRAAVLERALALLPPGAVEDRVVLARAVEAAAERALAARHPDRPLRANVEFYTAVLLEAVGLPRAAFAPMFAVGRVAGWCAHILEQRARRRLIRPQSVYVGPSPPAGS